MFHILIVWSFEELARRVQDGSACKGSKLSAVTCTYESTHDKNEYEYEVEEGRNEKF